MGNGSLVEPALMHKSSDGYSYVTFGSVTTALNSISSSTQPLEASTSYDVYFYAEDAQDGLHMSEAGILASVVPVNTTELLPVGRNRDISLEVDFVLDGTCEELTNFDV